MKKLLLEYRRLVEKLYREVSTIYTFNSGISKEDITKTELDLKNKENQILNYKQRT